MRLRFYLVVIMSLLIMNSLLNSYLLRSNRLVQRQLIFKQYAKKITTKSATTTDEEKPKVKRKSPVKKASKVIDESNIKTTVNVIDSGSRRMNILIPRDNTHDNIIVQEAFQPHKNVQRWIIFSDLHVKASSIDICEQVLYQVHEAAIAKDAGMYSHIHILICSFNHHYKSYFLLTIYAYVYIHRCNLSR